MNSSEFEILEGPTTKARREAISEKGMVSAEDKYQPLGENVGGNAGQEGKI